MYSTAVDLWFDYIRGYLSGFLAPGKHPSRAVVVRQEDILRRPQEVVEALERLGLSRNGIAFQINEQLEIGYVGISRTSILEREDNVLRWTSLTVFLQSTILPRLKELGCAPYMAPLGHAMPERTWSAEHTHAMRLGV